MAIRSLLLNRTYTLVGWKNEVIKKNNHSSPGGSFLDVSCLFIRNLVM